MIACLCPMLAVAMAGAPTDAEAVLERVRTALGLHNRPALLVAAGTADFRGQEVPFTLSIGRDRAFVAELAGPLPLITGYDGDVSWERDWTDTPRLLVLGEHDAALLSTWTVTGHWADPDAGLSFTLVPSSDDRAGDSRQAAGDITLAFTMEGSPITGTVRLDAATHLPERFEWTTGTSTSVQELTGFGRLAGAVLPTGVVQTGSDSDTFAVVLEHVGEPTADPAALAPRLTPPDDTRFDPAIAPEVEVKRAPTGHLLVHPTVDGRDLGWFIFDSGAGGNVMSIPVAEEAGFEAFGTVPARGVGGTTDAHFYRARSLALGPVTIDDPVFVGIDLAFLDQYMGVRVAGVLGYELFARIVAEFDITGARIAIHDPRVYDGQGRDWQPLYLYNRHPCVTARFEDRDGTFLLDTGAAQAFVAFHAPATRQLGLLEGRETVEVNLGGVGGSVSARSGIIDWFELGGLRREAIRASFATMDVGAFADPYLVGSIGGQLMAPFTLVLDYQNQRIAFVPREP